MKFTFESRIFSRKIVNAGKETGILMSGARRDLAPFVGKKVMVTVEDIEEEEVVEPPMTDETVVKLPGVIWPIFNR
jgi:hypothetical protein